MRALQRRLAALEKALGPPEQEKIYMVCINTERGDLAWIGGQWVEVDDVQAILDKGWGTKVYPGWIPP
jgi:hypothetical protein